MKFAGFREVLILSKLFRRRSIVQNKILDLLKHHQAPIKRFDLLCSIYGFRQVGGNILVWSIKERNLLQDEQFDKAAELLDTVLTVCNEISLSKKQKELKAQKRFNLIQPPIEPSPLTAVIKNAQLHSVHSLVSEIHRSKSHRWYQLDKEIKPFIEKWRWRDWMRHSIERECANSPEIDKEKNEAQVNFSRAIKSLQSAKKIQIEGTRKKMLISLLEPS